MVEKKFIHTGGSVGHIEDIAVTESRRRQGLGKTLIQTLLNISQEQKCYKVILDCRDTVKGFYEKCGVHYKDNCMCIRYDHWTYENDNRIVSVLCFNSV